MLTAPPLVGFNNNVRYRGRRFHIQTEDSGISRPHIITQLFADGGHVIKSLRTDYAEHLDQPDRPTIVHRLMREQHLAMALDLRDGRLDAILDGLVTSRPEDILSLRSGPARTSAEQRATLPDRISTPPGPLSQEPAAPTVPASAPETEAPDTQASPTDGQPSNHHRRPSRAPDVPRQRDRSATPNLGRAQPKKGGRPSASDVLPGKPSGDSIFGAAPQESLDDVILSYVSSTKGAPSSRRNKP
jgi:hypothetical protein